MSAPQRLSGQVSIVTGAGGGQGRAVALRYAQEGAAVAVNDVDESAALETVKAARRCGARALAVSGDVSDPLQVEAMVAQAAETLGPATILYNNAAINRPGAGGDGPVTELRLDVWERVLAVNLTGVMLMCRAVLPAMVEAGYGRIINVSSVTSKLGVGSHAYTAAKGGVNSLTRAIAYAYAPHVTANVICPGTISSPMTLTTLADPSRQKYWGDKSLSGRLGEPDDVVGLAVYLAGPESAYMTGSIVTLDGGATIH